MKKLAKKEATKFSAEATKTGGGRNEAQLNDLFGFSDKEIRGLSNPLDSDSILLNDDENAEESIVSYATSASASKKNLSARKGKCLR